MKKTAIDFDTIVDLEGFYDQIEKEWEMPAYFGRNLDALYDYLTGEIKLPLELKIYHISMAQLDHFSALFSVLQEVAEELKDFKLSLFLKED